MDQKNNYFFNISLSVLNHLGRNLYRSFVTVLGEAISNAWDADARKVYIQIDNNGENMLIQDDGIGMSPTSFQDKFLKVGYSKRKDGNTHSLGSRPYIGRKGIGKLALLSCAKRIHIISTADGTETVEATIDNDSLDSAIGNDETNYSLTDIPSDIKNHIKNNRQLMIDDKHGCTIYFEGLKYPNKHKAEYLRKIIALYFRFSLIDNNFSIYVNDIEVTSNDLKDLIKKTQFLWNINSTIGDPYLDAVCNVARSSINESFPINSVKGFIVSVETPKNLVVNGLDERVSVDLYVNGRLREKDILKHIKSNRIPETYLYGQLYYNELDDDEDRFTSSREGVKADDLKYQTFLKHLQVLINNIINQWDEERRKNRDDGDPDNNSLSPVDRKKNELINAISKENRKKRKKASVLDPWLSMLYREATENTESYYDCFIIENLIRKYIEYNKISLSKYEAKIKKYESREKKTKSRANVNISIRKDDNETLYLGIDELFDIIDENETIKEKKYTYKLPRNAIMHTSTLTDAAMISLKNVSNELKVLLEQMLLDDNSII